MLRRGVNYTVAYGDWCKRRCALVNDSAAMSMLTTGHVHVYNMQQRCHVAAVGTSNILKFKFCCTSWRYGTRTKGRGIRTIRIVITSTGLLQYPQRV